MTTSPSERGEKHVINYSLKTAKDVYREFHPGSKMIAAQQEAYNRGDKFYFQWIGPPVYTDDIYKIHLHTDLRFSRLLDSNRSNDFNTTGKTVCNLACPTMIPGLYAFFSYIQEWLSEAEVSISDEIFLIVRFFGILFGRFNVAACPELYRAYSYMRWLENMIYFERLRHFIITGKEELLDNLFDTDSVISSVMDRWYTCEDNCMLYDKFCELPPLADDKSSLYTRMDRYANVLYGYHPGAGNSWLYHIIVEILMENICDDIDDYRDTDEQMDRGAIRIIVSRIIGRTETPFHEIAMEGAHSITNLIDYDTRSVVMNPRFERLMNATMSPIRYTIEDYDRAYYLSTEVLSVTNINDMFSVYSMKLKCKFERYSVYRQSDGKFCTRMTVKSSFKHLLYDKGSNNCNESVKLARFRYRNNIIPTSYLTDELMAINTIEEIAPSVIKKTADAKPIPVIRGVALANDILDKQVKKFSPIEIFNKTKYVAPRKSFYVKLADKIKKIEDLSIAKQDVQKIKAETKVKKLKEKYESVVIKEIDRLSKDIDSFDSKLRLAVFRAEKHELEVARIASISAVASLKSFRELQVNKNLNQLMMIKKKVIITKAIADGSNTDFSLPIDATKAQLLDKAYVQNGKLAEMDATLMKKKTELKVLDNMYNDRVRLAKEEQNRRNEQDEFDRKAYIAISKNLESSGISYGSKQCLNDMNWETYEISENQISQKTSSQNSPSLKKD